MLRNASVVVLVLISLQASPALALTGRVVTPAGEAVRGAEVSVLGRPGTAVTDADGRFTLSPDPPVPFEVLVIAPGGLFMRPILVQRLDPEQALVLTVESLVSERITVSGAAPDIEATPSAATASLSHAEIQTRLPSNLVQALENVAGVNQVSEGQAAVPAVRGLSGGRTLILIDGARVSSERRAGASATFLDPEVLEGVDVARGPGSVAYGSDAFGGVIAVTTRKVAPGSPLAGRVSTTFGTGVPERRVGADVSKGLAEGSLLLAVHARRANDWDSPSGTVFNSGYRDAGLLAKATHTIGTGFVAASYQGDFGRDIERPRNNSRTVRFFYPEESSHRLTAEYDVPAVGPFEELGLNVFYGRYGQVTDQDRFPTATQPRSVDRAEVGAHDFQFRGYARRGIRVARVELGVDLNGRAGLRALDIFERYTLAGALTTTENVAIDSARRVDLAAYSSVTAVVAPTLSVAGGARVDYITTSNSGGYFGSRDTGNGALSGYAALTAGSYRGLTLTAQLARGFRDPVLSDRYFRGPSGRGFVTGNPELGPESSVQADLGARYTSRRVRAAVYAYQYRISDLIERFQTTPDDFFFRNRGRVQLRGVEAEAQLDLPGRITVDAAAQLARGRALGADVLLDGITPPTGSVQVRRAVRTSGFVQARTAWFAEDDRPGPTERVVPGYQLVDVSAGVAVSRHLELRMLVRNLLDDDYLASQDVRAVAAPGRSASITAVVRF
jgi:outer membrane receptor protein involved in Fe transport